MELPSGFVLKAVRANKESQMETGKGKMLLIVGKRYAHLQKALRETFDGQEDVEIWVDRRKGQKGRRKGGVPVPVDRKQTDRRKRKEEVLEIILSA
jgi:hypothetical protein